MRVVAGTRGYRLTLLGLGVLAVALLLALPYAIGTISGIGTLSQLVAYGVAIVGLGLLIGYCGQISLGGSAFVGLGGYTTIILVADHGWPYLATLPVSIVICLVAGALIGMPALRIQGLYLATLTLAIAALFPVVVDKFAGLTGGPNGKVAEDPMQVPTWLPVDPYSVTGPATIRFYTIVLVAVVAFLVAYNIVHSRIGRAMIAVRDAPLGAAAAGVPVARVKIFAFAMSAAFGGVAGSLLVIQLPEVSSARFNLNLSIFLLVALIAGGSRTIWGAIPGAIVFVTLRTSIADWASDQALFSGPRAGQLVGILSGVLLLAFIFLLPGGVADGVRRLFRRFVDVVPTSPRGWQDHQLLPARETPVPAEKRLVP
ncbi:branched-chain amino acid ABC transporter permease [Cryptosporangium sp. NPDC048952]|uniref:branched-chain amino acid ABC transporter permease n=1 Tax=Cryptosporangium sp. NPDC048952 TaxID=3363961 RepID=UPI00371030FB